MLIMVLLWLIRTVRGSHRRRSLHGRSVCARQALRGSLRIERQSQAGGLRRGQRMEYTEHDTTAVRWLRHCQREYDAQTMPEASFNST